MTGGESKLTGPWKDTAEALKAVNKNVRDSIKKATAKNLLVLEAALVKHLQNQDLKWPSLNKIYKKWKEHQKLSNQIWIATSTLMNSITSQVTEDGYGGFVGVLRSAPAKKRPGSDKPVKPVVLAAVHEFGIGVPERPLFRPTFAEKAKELADNYVNGIIKGLGELVNQK